MSFTSRTRSFPRMRETSRRTALNWVPAFAGMIGLFCVSCSETSPGQSINPEAVAEKPAFRSFNVEQRKKLNNWMGEQLSERPLENGTFTLGMSEHRADKEIGELGYKFKNTIISISRPMFNPNSPQKCKLGSKAVSYDLTADFHHLENIEILYANFGGIIVNDKCVYGLTKIPEIIQYEKNNAKNK